eukprot:Phypoly_transcript_05947.p1 GENE.Phypoly_transcript_05947~~Phypoly_transcript_05947.p1  ORF type:complete len:331 (+),score=27.69 Phypoly_transcript_05947:825-1817(+)
MAPGERIPRTLEHLAVFYELRVLTGEAALEHGEAKARAIFKHKRGFVHYWKRKALLKNFHGGTHGGFRRFKFTTEEKLHIGAILWKHAKKHPLARLGEYKRKLSKSGFDVSLSEICKIFKSWRWSFKKPHRKHKLENIEYYGEFKYAIQFIPWEKLKFCDESHFVSRDLCRDKALSAVGESLDVPSSDMNDESFTMTLALSLSPTRTVPFEFDLRIGSNTQWDFVNFVLHLVESNFFDEGDYFFVDNASVHHGSGAFTVLCELLDAVGVHLVFLPKYSPELNPCEEVFALIKGRLRCYRGSARFWEEIVESLGNVSYTHVYKFYKNAIVI